LLTWSLTNASNHSAESSLTWGAVVLGVAMLAAFVCYEGRQADHAIMPLAMFTSWSFVGLTLLTFFLYGSLSGLLVLLPYLLIRVEHWSAVSAGAALLPIPALIGAGSRLMGRVSARFGGRLPLSIGSLLVAIGLVLYVRVSPGPVEYWTVILPPTLLVALGMTASVAPLTTTVMASVDIEHVGIASGFNSAVARIAGLVATALLGFVLARQASPDIFIAGCRIAAVVGGASAAFASVSALILIRPIPPGAVKPK
jgi:predicted MFS family arabinose efflux permease